MTEHLPECVASVVRMKYDATYCICPDLRACEERMLSDDIPAAAYHGQKGYQIGYIAGLDAAREAVAEMVIETVGNSAATVAQALAAIDALRDKP